MRSRRQGGFVTPVGWIYFTLLLVVIVAVVSVVVWAIASANVAIAQRVAELVATNGATLGLQFLINGTLPNSPIPIIALPEPTRTTEVFNYVAVQAQPAGVLARYLSPLLLADVVVAVSPVLPVNASVTVTARTGKRGQFSATVTRSAAVRAANRIDAGRLVSDGKGATALTGGVLPLAVDMRALDPRRELVAHDGWVPLSIGKTAFAVRPEIASQVEKAEDGDLVNPTDSGANELLIAAAEFLAFDGIGEPGGTPPPSFSVGQHVVFSSVSGGEEAAVAEAEVVGETATNRGPSAVRGVTAALLQELEGRAVIVPVIEDKKIRGFAVALLRSEGEEGESELALKLLPSALSPLARVDRQAEPVPAELSSVGGLALALSMPDPSRGSMGLAAGSSLEIVG